jgi:cation diffusion facilitator family transporter
LRFSKKVYQGLTTPIYNDSNCFSLSLFTDFLILALEQSLVNRKIFCLEQQMHIKTLKTWQHHHDFAVIHEHGERRTIQVLVLTAVTMVIEIVAGVLFGSMALFADGWHMGTHVAAFLITIFAYRYARKNADSPKFTFGTGKVGVLGGFASAIALAVVALVMAIESIQRLVKPQVIHFDEAIGVAIFGLLINLLSAFLLRGHHHKDDHHHDHNLRAAYLHVLADALTSVLALVALFSGKIFGWNQLDSIMGIAGAAVIMRWSYGLLKDTGPILLDSGIQEAYRLNIRRKIEGAADNRVSDLHLWKVSPDHYAVIVSLVTHYPKPLDHYKKLLAEFRELSHITIEVNPCEGEPCMVIQ